MQSLIANSLAAKQGPLESVDDPRSLCSRAPFWHAY